MASSHSWDKVKRSPLEDREKGLCSDLIFLHIFTKICNSYIFTLFSIFLSIFVFPSSMFHIYKEDLDNNTDEADTKEDSTADECEGNKRLSHPLRILSASLGFHRLIAPGYFVILASYC